MTHTSVKFKKILAAQSCLTLCNPMDCSLPGSSVHGDSPGKNTGVDCHSLLQGSNSLTIIVLSALICLSYLSHTQILYHYFLFYGKSEVNFSPEI